MNIEHFKEILGERFSRDADFLSSFVTQLNLPKDSKILDVGTGWGTMAIILALHGFKIITGEPEGTSWADWRSSAKKVNVEDLIEFKPLNAEKLPFIEGEFDIIFLYTTFHHIGDKVRAFGELLRVLGPKGLLIIIELTDEGVKMVRETYRMHPDAIDPRDFTKNLDLEIKVIESRYLNSYMFRKC